MVHPFYFKIQSFVKLKAGSWLMAIDIKKTSGARFFCQILAVAGLSVSYAKYIFSKNSVDRKA